MVFFLSLSAVLYKVHTFSKIDTFAVCITSAMDRSQEIKKLSINLIVLKYSFNVAVYLLHMFFF